MKTRHRFFSFCVRPAYTVATPQDQLLSSKDRQGPTADGTAFFLFGQKRQLSHHSRPPPSFSLVCFQKDGGRHQVFTKTAKLNFAQPVDADCA